MTLRPSAPWMETAESLIGLAEIVGPKHDARIIRMWESIKAPFRDDETPWCAGYVGHCLEAANYRSTRSAAARSYLKWGIDPRKGGTVAEIPYGAIIVLSRPGADWSGHVGFYAGPSGSGFALLGGNQNNAVRVSSYLWSRIIGVRWPVDWPIPQSPHMYPNLIGVKASTSDA
jgi:uncharacterized protein (TIGR02594 family)